MGAHAGGGEGSRRRGARVLTRLRYREIRSAPCRVVVGKKKDAEEEEEEEEERISTRGYVRL